MLGRCLAAVKKIVSPFSPPRIVALLGVRNEALYMERCLEHLYSQGIETCVIDNESTDATVEIARRFIGRGVFRIVTKPYEGYFDLAGMLELEERLSREIEADWFIHHDADEIREAPKPWKTLREGILAVDRAGFNAVNLDEFVFLPTSDEESYEGRDYVKEMRYYYFFEPSPLRQVKIWKNGGQSVDLVSSGGHRVDFEGIKIYPENFILRHYIVLSREHAIAKYGRERVYSRKEIEERRWHGQRADFDPGRLVFMSRDELIPVDPGGVWNRNNPHRRHRLFGGDAQNV